MRKFLIVAAALWFSTANALTFEEVKDIVVRNDIKTIGDLLSRLPAEYRAEFTLMMKSQSLQGAGINYPRVIMTGTDGRLLMAFNGDPSQKGYDSLELIQFRDDKARFDFFEIRFPEKDQNGRALNNLTNAEISKRNPAKCLACHSSDPRPNWEHYNKWPGAFMGNDDSDNLEPEFPPLDVYKTHMATVFPQHARYKYLEKAVEGYSKENEYGRPTQHNIFTTERIQRLNYLRVGRLLKSDPYYSAYKYLMVGMIACGDNVGNYVSYLPAHFPGFDVHVDNFAQTDFYDVFLKRKLYIHDLYPAFKTAAPFWTVPSFSTTHLSYSIVYDDPDLASHFDIRSSEYYGFNGGAAIPKDCAGLRDKSREALKNVPRPADEALTREQSQPKILKRCMECHTSGAIGSAGPHIPFDNVKRLKQHLNYEGYPHGGFLDEVVYRVSASGNQRMPPEGMSESDRSELTNYLRGIK